eukprot:1131424-Rhodomonas_salina.1
MKVAILSQSNPFASGMSTLTAKLAPSCDVPAGSEVLIKGLKRSGSVDREFLRIEMPTDDDAFEGTGQWKQESGQLRL